MPMIELSMKSKINVVYESCIMHQKYPTQDFFLQGLIKRVNMLPVEP
jgi:hypothetical protein